MTVVFALVVDLAPVDRRGIVIVAVHRSSVAASGVFAAAAERAGIADEVAVAGAAAVPRLVFAPSGMRIACVFGAD